MIQNPLVFKEQNLSFRQRLHHALFMHRSLWTASGRLFNIPQFLVL
jgi:hypothetical protein